MTTPRPLDSLQGRALALALVAFTLVVIEQPSSWANTSGKAIGLKKTGRVGPWKPVGTTDGVSVHLRTIPNYRLPQMRGRVVIAASIYEVFAVLEDTKRHPQWMAKTSAARMVHSGAGFNRIVWTRKKTPWPAQDRDAVLRVTVTVDPAKKRLRSRFSVTRHTSAPKLSGVTRMPSLDGYFDLIATGPKTTRVTYVLKADMGGWIPDWLCRLISKKLPLRDLQGLRRQTLKMRGQYGAFLQRVDPALGGFMAIRLAAPAHSAAPKPTASKPTASRPVVARPAAVTGG